MSGFFQAFWFWLPVLIFKIFASLFKSIWNFNLWALQMICGVPLFYCKPGYRIPGIFLGTMGMISVLFFLISLLIMGAGADGKYAQPQVPIGEILIMGGLGIIFIIICRLLIRRGSI